MSLRLSHMRGEGSSQLGFTQWILSDFVQIAERFKMSITSERFSYIEDIHFGSLVLDTENWMLHKCHDFSANAEFLLFPKRANSAERGLSMPSSKVLAFGRGDASSAKEPAANILHQLWHSSSSAWGYSVCWKAVFIAIYVCLCSFNS